jgi:A/G-specific adenine glycosylase
MMEVPSTQWRDKLPRDPASQAPLAAQWRKLHGKVEHTFTHFHLELTVLRAVTIDNGELRDNGDYRWVSPQSLHAEALPTVMRKIVAHVLNG